MSWLDQRCRELDPPPPPPTTTPTPFLVFLTVSFPLSNPLFCSVSARFVVFQRLIAGAKDLYRETELAWRFAKRVQKITPLLLKLTIYYNMCRWWPFKNCERGWRVVLAAKGIFCEILDQAFIGGID